MVIRSISAWITAIRPVSMAIQSLNLECSIRRRHAVFLFCHWLRSSRDSARAPDGWWMILTPVSRLFWFCPPDPPALKV